MGLTIPSVLICYSHRDEEWKDLVEAHLHVLETQGALSVWHDRTIPGGALWRKEIEKALSRADVVLFLVSTNFFNSKFIQQEEIPRVLKRSQSSRVRVIPVILEPCPWKSVKWLDPIQARPKDGRPLSTLERSAIQAALAELALEIANPMAGHSPQLRAEHQSPLSADRPNNLPFRTNRFFKGRSAEMEMLRQLLTRNNVAAVTQPVALHGLGGVGKTQLALEYAWRFEHEYQAVLWVKADSVDALHTNVAALTEILQLPEAIALEQEAQFQAVIQWLKREAGWLLIFDNVDTPETANAVHVLLPPTAKGHVLVTSRRSDWWKWPDTSEVRLEVLLLEEAADFLMLRTESPAKDRRAATRLAEGLGCLPLALEHAAAYIRRRGGNLDGYLRSFQVAQGDLLQEGSEGGTQYLTSVNATWQISIAQVSHLARCVLQISAFLAPEEIPISLFRSSKALLGQALQLGGETEKHASQRTGRKLGSDTVTESAIERALTELNDYSLVLLRNDTFSVHRLVQAVQSARLDGEARKGWTELALRLTSQYAPQDAGDVHAWPVWNSLYPHAAVVVEHARKADIYDPTSELLSQLGAYCYGRALYREAEPYLREAMAIDERCLGSSHPDLARRLSHLAGLLHVTGRLSEAETLYRRALAIDEEAGDPDDPNLSRDLSNLAGVLGATNRLVEAESLVRRVLAIDESHFGPNHPEVAIDLNNLAGLLRATGNRKAAEPLYRRALAIDQQHFDLNHPVIARDLNNLAMSLLAANNMSEAEPLVRRALAIDEQTFGPGHPNTATGLNDLAMILSATGRFEEAEPLYKQALAIDQQSYGPIHPKVARDLSNLAALYRATHRLADAEPLYRRALQINERVMGPNHPAVGFDLNNLAILLRGTNRLIEAEPLYRRALAVLVDALGPSDPKVGTILENLEAVLRGLGRTSQANAISDRARKIRKEVQLRHSPQAVKTAGTEMKSRLRKRRIRSR